jgi:hypothetical protein
MMFCVGKCHDIVSRFPVMVERRIELNRRRHRKEKMTKLKGKLEATKDARQREEIIKKIHRLSPFWTEPAKV